VISSSQLTFCDRLLFQKLKHHCWTACNNWIMPNMSASDANAQEDTCMQVEAAAAAKARAAAKKAREEAALLASAERQMAAACAAAAEKAAGREQGQQEVC
jgi:flagellar biosynthesis/type III secretory pathway protein FliH